MTDTLIKDTIDNVNTVIDNPTVQLTISKVTPKISAKARNIIYTIGFYAGLVGVIAPVIAAVLTGDAQFAVATIGAVALAFNSWLAKANLSKTAEDIKANPDLGLAPNGMAG